ncbi:MAG TPA: UvrD-helicase domain-containing protein [Sporichthya sp.]|nr:UvrD-helicase domain-containing protein [Sporichthya sp.]
MTEVLAAPEPVSFDLLGPLPTGTTLLEASAGTGKTYTIAALVTRYVAEGAVDLAELLVVTFGRAATRELRERVRERLTHARDALADPAAALVGTDPVHRHLATGDPAEVAARRRRLALATADFDAATIATTHSFCQLVLRGLGTAADTDPDAELVSELGDLVSEVAADLYLRKYHSYPSAPEFPLKLAHTIARAAATDVHAALAPDSAGPDAGALRARYARVVRDELALRLARRRQMGFDDLLTRLRNALLDDGTGPRVAGELRRRYKVVLVDEFQDTDPAQWDILRTAFDGHAALVLIGDPKQAIYAFRGGDVHSYLAAAERAVTRATLPQNFRSDERVLAGLAALLGGAELGDPRIVVGPVQAGNPEPLLTRTAAGPPVRLRVVPSDGMRLTKDGMPYVDDARDAVVLDLVGQIVEVLTDSSRLRDGVTEEGAGERDVQPGDIAVLVSTHKEGELVRAALVEAGVPTVVQSSASVFGTPAATEWVALLEAIEAPHRAGLVRRLAISPFVGFDAADLVNGGDAAHDLLAQRVRFWGHTLENRGVAALLAAVDADYRVLSRLLGEVGGERTATDIRHIGDVLHAAAVTERLGPTALLTWLRRRIAEVGVEATAERSRRLDSDAAAVQVVTIWTSKGLEFPLVYLPFAWSRFVGRPDVALFHDRHTGSRTRHVGGNGTAGWDSAVAAHHAESAGEDLRLLYVAATRARSQLTLWWARSANTPTSALHRLLFSPAGGAAPASVGVPDDAAALAALQSRAASADGALQVEAVLPGPARAWTAPAPPGGIPVAAVFDRAVDTAWRRTSYSALTAAAHAAGPSVAVEPESEGKTDEPEPEDEDAPARPAGRVAEPSDAWAALPSPFGTLPGGTAFGTLTHAVLELVDPSAPDLHAALLAATESAMRRTPVVGVPADALADALTVAMATPLGPLAGGRPLAEIPGSDRLVELDFELPLAGGDRPRRGAVLGEMAALLRSHLADDDPVRPYADRLAEPDLAESPLRGYLTGSIDAVLRVPGDGGPRFLVVDYKSNVLHPPDVTPTAWHYRPEVLAPAMRAADYPLQALLYQVALHRYLTWRQPGYDPEAQLGGVLYLYLRGMCGPGTTAADGDVPGVFAWRPPAALVLALSDLLAGGGV